MNARHLRFQCYSSTVRPHQRLGNLWYKNFTTTNANQSRRRIISSSNLNLTKNPLNRPRNPTTTAFQPTVPTTNSSTIRPIMSSSTNQLTLPNPPQHPQVKSITDLPTNEAKWTSLQKITFLDQTGEERTWEMAIRRTRGTSAVDAVAIGNILLHPSRPPSTVLAIQYRPPLDAYTVEWPAGLVDADETPEQAAIRELKEETGYEGKVLSVSEPMASDPGLTNANLVLCMMEVQLAEGDPEPEQMLDEGEFITRVTVPLAELYPRLLQYSKTERMVVAAKLFYFAAGLDFARNSKYL